MRKQLVTKKTFVLLHGVNLNFKCQLSLDFEWNLLCEFLGFVLRLLANTV